MMKAIVYDRYGPPEVLRVEDVERPVPGSKEVLVRVHAAVVSAADATFRAGRPLYSRLFTGLRGPKNRTLGCDLAGEVAEIGTDVTRFAVGDRVVADTGTALGAHAEYVRLPEDGALAPAPSNLSHTEAAAVCDGLLTALPFLRDRAALREGQEILVNGASGGVGKAAVQLAAHFGARVTGVCSTPKLDLVKSMGADEVIDYTAQDFTRTPRSYDVVFDAAGKSSFARCSRLLKPGGIYLTTVPSPAIFFHMFRPLKSNGRRAAIAFTGLRPARDRADDLRFLTELAEAGHLKPSIDTIHPPHRAAEAHHRAEAGQKKGTVLLTLAPDAAC
ncbi:NAD(P)-dependent alcohol dehydrogenase [Actinocorallia aurantiaca]|uniref:NAD(P)-dependent alcohol dehydrogenase n=2 Tax=Actinocorallia aurantiaca TaxID=46204 RepID=A0ABN3UU62_9ACTN